jgi:hypothetical protein
VVEGVGFNAIYAVRDLDIRQATAAAERITANCNATVAPDAPNGRVAWCDRDVRRVNVALERPVSPRCVASCDGRRGRSLRPTTVVVRRVIGVCRSTHRERQTPQFPAFVERCVSDYLLHHRADLPFGLRTSFDPSGCLSFGQRRKAFTVLHKSGRVEIGLIYIAANASQYSVVQDRHWSRRLMSRGAGSR